MAIDGFETQGGSKNYKGQYASLKFPRYVYKEYPKHVKDPEGKVLGVAGNAMEEAELLANAGLDAQVVDPVAAMRAELEEAKRKLSQYEGKDPANQIAAKNLGKQTASVEMLPAESPTESSALAAGGKPENPLLKKHDPHVVTGAPQPQGSAPKVGAPLKSGV